MTRAEALRWGRGDKRRLSVRDYPPAVVQLVDERLGGRRCVDCVALQLVTPASEPLELDHLQALARGGDNHHLNLTWRCRSHNRAKIDKSALETPELPAWHRRAVRAGGDRHERTS